MNVPDSKKTSTSWFGRFYCCGAYSDPSVTDGSQMDGLGPVTKNENLYEKGYGSNITAGDDDGACNVVDDDSGDGEILTGRDAACVHNFNGIDIEDQ